MFEQVEHVGILLALLGALFGLVRGMQAWRRERLEAARARIRHEQMLDEVLDEFRGPDSLRDKVESLSDLISDHLRRSAEVWDANSREHSAMHRRIDHLYEVLPTNAGYRRLADQHRAQRGEGDEDG